MNRCIFLLHFLLRALHSEYTEYAQIESTEKGHRLLWVNGHKFGYYYQSSNDATWKCTRRGIVGLDGVKKRCNARMKTKTINGYEMIQSSKCVHDHD